MSEPAVEQHKRVLRNHSSCDKHVTAAGIETTYVKKTNKKRQKIYINTENNDAIVVFNDNNNNNMNVEYILEDNGNYNQCNLTNDSQMPLYYEIKFCVLFLV